MVFTVIEYLPNSFASDLPNAIVPPLAAAVIAKFASPTLELSPTIFIILPSYIIWYIEINVKLFIKFFSEWILTSCYFYIESK